MLTLHCLMSAISYSERTKKNLILIISAWMVERQCCIVRSTSWSSFYPRVINYSQHVVIWNRVNGTLTELFAGFETFVSKLHTFARASLYSPRTNGVDPVMETDGSVINRSNSNYTDALGKLLSKLSVIFMKLLILDFTWNIRATINQEAGLASNFRDNRVYFFFLHPCN